LSLLYLTELEGIGFDKNFGRQDPSNVIKVGDTYHVYTSEFPFAVGTESSSQNHQERIILSLIAQSQAGSLRYLFPVENNPAPTTGTIAPVFANGGKSKGSRRYRWSFDTAVQVRAMLLAADRLFVAGWHDSHDPGVVKAALDNRRGGMILAISAEDGRKPTEYELESPPV
jgi:hypothetical protein